MWGYPVLLLFEMPPAARNRAQHTQVQDWKACVLRTTWHTTQSSEKTYCKAAWLLNSSICVLMVGQLSGDMLGPLRFWDTAQKSQITVEFFSWRVLLKLLV